MRLTQAKECIKELYKNTDSVVALISERGVGKTSAFSQCADELNIGYISLYAAALEGPDFMGLPDKDTKAGITRYLAPQFLPTETAIKNGLFPEKGILVIEEINRVPSDTTSVLYPLLLEKTINGHRMAEGWAIGVTMNPDTMNYMVNALDDAMLDRFISVEIQANLDDYINYSQNSRQHDQRVLAFLSGTPDMLLAIKRTGESNALAKAPTPRGWTRVQELLHSCNLPAKMMQELISGIVGPEAAASFYGFLADSELIIPDAEGILTNSSQHDSALTNLLEKNRFDIISYINDRILEFLSPFDTIEEYNENLDHYLQLLPLELRIVFYKKAQDRDRQLFEKLTETTDSFIDVADALLDSLEV